MEQIRRRGSWLSSKGLERYTKVAHLVADISRLPAAVARYGEEILANPSKYITIPSQAGVFFMLLQHRLLFAARAATGAQQRFFA